MVSGDETCPQHTSFIVHYQIAIVNYSPIGSNARAAGEKTGALSAPVRGAEPFKGGLLMWKEPKRLLEAAGMLLILALTAAVFYLLLLYPGDLSARQTENRRVFGATSRTMNNP